jgi:ferredoxin--NADP+ reductase
MAAAEYNATVVQRVELAPGLIILRIVPDTLRLEFTAGQYVVLGLKASEPRIDEAEPDQLSYRPADDGAATGGTIPAAGEAPTGPSAESAAERAITTALPDPDKMIRRAYSIASHSRSDEFLEFYITIVMSGDLTPRLFNLGIKDRIYVGPKAVGMFTLAKAPRDHHVILVATGTGLAPYVSMLRSDLECGGTRRIVVLHGARCSWDLAYRTELTSLARHCPNLTYIPVITRPQEDPTWRGRTGYLQDVLLSGAIEEATDLELLPANYHVYLCGNPGMIETVIERLSVRGFVRDRGHDIGTLHTEEYW